MGSADWMPRNFYRRIEAVFPILDGNLRERITSELVAVPLADNTRARLLQPDGNYRLADRKRGVKARRSQFEFIAHAVSGNTPLVRLPAAKNRYPEVKLAKRPF